MAKTRAAVVDLALSWVGRNEADGTHKPIVDIYNKQGSLPRGYKVKYTDAWCATFWSALAIKLGYTSIMPVECSCYYLIEEAKKMGIWIEDDAHMPQLGEAILYDWDDSGIGDCKGSPEHVGVVTEVHGTQFVVTEGNYKDAVKKRTMSVNGRYIRGYISPKYEEDGKVSTPSHIGGKSIDTVAREVIAGTWGNGDARRQALTAAGYDYNKVRARVNQLLNGNISAPEDQWAGRLTATDSAKRLDESLAGTYRVTASDFLYMRHGAGTNKRAMCKLPAGTKVQCYGYYTSANGTKWLYIQAKVDGNTYTGFSSINYLDRV